MKILILSVHTCPLEQPGTRYAGGLNIYVRNLALCLSKHYRIASDIFTLKHQGYKQVVRLGQDVRIIHISLKKENLKKEEISKHVEEFSQKVLAFIKSQKNQYELINTHYYLSGLVGEILKENLKIPHVITFHTLAKIKNLFGEHESEKRAKQEAKIIKSAEQIIATTNFEKQKLIDLYGAADKKIFVIPGGVDLELFKPRDKQRARKKLNLPQDKKIILFVGRLDPIKGLKTLIRSVPYVVEALCQARCRVKFLVVGSRLTSQNKLSREIQLEIKDKKISKHINFLGSKPTKIMPYFYTAADLTVIPSNYESFSLTALEAMACNSPVLASKVANLTFLIENRKTGLFFESGNPKDLARKSLKLISDKDLRNKITRSAHGFATEHHWCRVTDEIVGVFSNTIKRDE